MEDNQESFAHILWHCHAIRKLSKLAGLCSPTITTREAIIDTLWIYLDDRKWLGDDAVGRRWRKALRALNNTKTPTHARPMVS